jgi:hypothetical protein
LPEAPPPAEPAPVAEPLVVEPLCDVVPLLVEPVVRLLDVLLAAAAPELDVPCAKATGAIKSNNGRASRPDRSAVIGISTGMRIGLDTDAD